VRVWDDVAAAPFLYNEQKRLFISYDDVQSMRVKGRYVLDRGLGGMMSWQLGSDPDGDLLTAICESLKP
jgi:chitinase